MKQFNIFFVCLLMSYPALADEINTYLKNNVVLVEYIDDNQTSHEREIPMEKLEESVDTLTDWIWHIKKELDKPKIVR